MKIGYFGDGPWASGALTTLLTRKELKIAFVSARSDGPDPVLTRIAEEAGIAVPIFDNINSRESLEAIRAYGCDLIVSMSFNQIMRTDFIGLTPNGVINCHAGALPFYRGRNPINWAVINSEKRVGVTVHYVDEGIDTGDIIVQNFIDIEAHDDYGSLLAKCHHTCATTLIEAIDAIRRGTSARQKQVEIQPFGIYCGRRVAGDEWIDWSWPSERIHNFVRAITTPGPGAFAAINDGIVCLYRSELAAQAPDYIGTPGEVVGRDAGGVFVKTGTSVIKIVQYRILDEAASELRTPRWKIGTRLLGRLDFRLSRIEKALSLPLV